MQPWQLAFLGRRELPIELTSFELHYFFSFSDDERQAIRTRRRALNQLGAALHLGFMKMSGCALDAFEMGVWSPVVRKRTLRNMAKAMTKSPGSTKKARAVTSLHQISNPMPLIRMQQV